jgi:hypothetical protein
MKGGIFKDSDGKGSSKRVAAFWLLVLITAQVVGVCFFHAAFNNSIWTDTMIAFGVSMGLVSTEKKGKSVNE